KALLSHLDLPLDDGVNALDRELVGLAERLEIAPLRRPYRLDVKGLQLEIGEHLGHIEIEKAGACVGHGEFHKWEKNFVQCTTSYMAVDQFFVKSILRCTKPRRRAAAPN